MLYVSNKKKKHNSAFLTIENKSQQQYIFICYFILFFKLVSALFTKAAFFSWKNICFKVFKLFYIRNFILFVESVTISYIKVIFSNVKQLL